MDKRRGRQVEIDGQVYHLVPSRHRFWGWDISSPSEGRLNGPGLSSIEDALAWIRKRHPGARPRVTILADPTD